MNLEQGGAQVLVGILMTFLLQWLKNQTWFPFLNGWSEKWWKLTVSAIVAFGTSLGLAFTFDPVMGQLVITGLTWENVGHAILAFLLSFATQHISYVTPGFGVKALMPTDGGSK